MRIVACCDHYLAIVVFCVCHACYPIIIIYWSNLACPRQLCWTYNRALNCCMLNSNFRHIQQKQMTLIMESDMLPTIYLAFVDIWHQLSEIFSIIFFLLFHFLCTHIAFILQQWTYNYYIMTSYRCIYRVGEIPLKKATVDGWNMWINT